MKKIYNEVFTQIYRTNDYDKFINVIGNRKVSGGNYAKLYNSMKERQMIIPILVNENFQIIDGQHRFICCKELGLDVYYYVIEGYNIESVKIINKNSKNWDIEDYLNLHKELEVRGLKNGTSYTVFYSLMNKYKISLNSLLEIFSKAQGATISEMKIAFEDGTFRTFDIDMVEDFLEKLQVFNQLKQYKQNKFIKAFLKIYSYDGYDHSIMLQKLEKLSYKLEKRTLVTEYVHMLIEDIYNYGSSKNKFRYDAGNDLFYTVK